MSSTQEKLEEIQATKVKSDKTRSGYEITLDPEYLTALIDSAKREAVLTELKWAKGASVWNIESRIAQLEQSEESE